MFSHLRGRARLVLVAGAMVLVAAGCVRPGVASGPACGGPGGPPDDVIATVLARTNSDRAAYGLPPLSWNPQLWCLASGWSAYMASSGSFGHQNLGAALNSPDYRGYNTLGENIAHGPGSMTGNQLEDAWMASPGHRANILSGSYSSIGIASAVAPDGTIYVTADFGG